MKELKLKTLWTLDIEINGQMIQVFCSEYKRFCIIEKNKVFYRDNKTTIQKRKVITDKY